MEQRNKQNGEASSLKDKTSGAQNSARLNIVGYLPFLVLFFGSMDVASAYVPRKVLKWLELPKNAYIEHYAHTRAL